MKLSMVLVEVQEEEWKIVSDYTKVNFNYFIYLRKMDLILKIINFSSQFYISWLLLIRTINKLKC